MSVAPRQKSRRTWRIAPVQTKGRSPVRGSSDPKIEAGGPRTGGGGCAFRRVVPAPPGVAILSPPRVPCNASRAKSEGRESGHAMAGSWSHLSGPRRPAHARLVVNRRPLPPAPQAGRVAGEDSLPRPPSHVRHAPSRQERGSQDRPGTPRTRHYIHHPRYLLPCSAGVRATRRQT